MAYHVLFCSGPKAERKTAKIVILLFVCSSEKQIPPNERCRRRRRRLESFMCHNLMSAGECPVPVTNAPTISKMGDGFSEILAQMIDVLVYIPLQMWRRP